MAKVCILDYGSGNVRSVFNLLSSVEQDVTVTNVPEHILGASHIVLPGVGAFGAAMRRINERLPLDVVSEAVFTRKTPFLGICVGLQVTAERGLEFGDHAGLGWIGGTVSRLETGDLPAPHVGWNNVHVEHSSPLFAGLGSDPDFYFVHSYVFRPTSPAVVAATTTYGETFCCAVQRDNVYGVQFHPEKSQKAGRRLVENFLGMDG